MDRHERYLALVMRTQERLQQEYIDEKVDTARATAALQGVLRSTSSTTTPSRATSPPPPNNNNNIITALEAANAELQRKYERAFTELRATQQLLAEYKVRYASLQFQDEARRMGMDVPPPPVTPRASPQASPLPSPSSLATTLRQELGDHAMPRKK
eukprot:PhM_4_TR5622/c1_g1_i1/m.62030